MTKSISPLVLNQEEPRSAWGKYSAWDKGVRDKNQGNQMPEKLKQN